MVPPQLQEAPVSSLAAPVPSAPVPSAADDPGADPGALLDARSQSVGRRIRELRRARGLTLVRLAGAAQLSHPFLSQLERGLARPSMASLDRIARALGTSQIELLSAGDDHDTPESGSSGTPFVGHDEGVRGSYGGAEARLLATGTRKLHAVEIRGTAPDPGDYVSHVEDEFVHVLDGSVLVDLAGEEPRILVPGDSFYCDGGTAHRWSAIDDDGFRMLIVKQKPRAL